jgi:amidase
MIAFLSQIERVNPKVNAICTFIGEEAASGGEQADDGCQGRESGPPHGLPHAVKDLVPSAGIR